jgi:hypothetical protein
METYTMMSPRLPQPDPEPNLPYPGPEPDRPEPDEDVPSTPAVPFMMMNWLI